MKEGKCPTCGAPENDLNKDFFGRFFVVGKSGSHTLFSSDIHKLVDIPLNLFSKTEELEDFLLDHLPLKGRGTFQNSKLRVLTAKRL